MLALKRLIIITSAYILPCDAGLLTSRLRLHSW